MHVAPGKEIECLLKNLIKGIQKASFWFYSKEGRENLIFITLVIYIFF